MQHIKKKLKFVYSSLLYKSYYDKQFRNEGIAACLLILVNIQFWMTLLIILPILTFKEESLKIPLVSLYLSISAAGIFYIIFNLYPEVRQKFRAAKEVLPFILKIKARRAKVLAELTSINGHEFFTEANRFLSKSKHLELIKMIRKKNGYTETPVDPSNPKQGCQIKYSINPPLNIPLNRNMTIDRFTVSTMDQMCEKIATNNLRDIRRIKEIPNIESLRLYDSLIYLENEMVQFIEQSYKDECSLVAYFLQAPDKVNYYAQKELPWYVGNRFDLKFTPTKDEKNVAKGLVTIFFEKT